MGIGWSEILKPSTSDPARILRIGLTAVAGAWMISTASAQDATDFLPASPLGEPSYAQGASACISFKSALDLASLNSPKVAIAKADLDVAQADLTDAKSLRRPQISAFTRSGFGDEGLVNTAIENQVGLRASQRIFDFGDSRLAREAAEEEITAQENLILSERSRAMLEAGIAYIDWLDASERLDATVERANYFLEELSALKLVLDSGGATISELAEISAESADAEADRFELEFEQQQALTLLHVTTRAKSKPCKKETTDLDQHLDILTNENGSAGVLTRALNQNAEVKALASFAKKLDIEAERQRRSRLPILEIVGITSLTSDRRFDNFEFRERIGFDATVPLYTGSSLSAKSDKARAQAQRAQNRAEEQKRLLEEQVVTTHKRALLLNAQLGRRQAVIEFREMELEAAKSGYENNIRTLPELVDVRLQLEDARLVEVRTRYDYYRQVLILKSLIGTL